MAKSFRIDLQLNNAQAEAAAAKSVAAIAAVEKAALKTAQAAERSIAREAAAREKAALQAQRAAERQAEREVREAERAARQRLMIEDRLVARENARMIAQVKAAQASADRGADAREKAAAREQRAAERAARARMLIDDRTAAREAARTAVSERAAERAAQATVRAKERESRQVQAIQDRFLKAEHDRMVATEKAKAKADEKSGGFGAKMVEINAALSIAQQGIGFVTGIVSGFEAVDSAVMRSADFVTDYRETLLELAALKGKLGNTGEVLKEELAFRAKTGQTQAEARSFQESFLGVAQSSIDAKNIKGEVIRKGLLTQEEADKLAVMGGKFQAVEHGDAATHGGLLGIIPQMIGRRTTAEEVFTKESQLYNIFQPGGVSFSSLAKQFTELTPLIKGGIYKDTEAAALTSAFSTIALGSGQAGTMVNQFTRATVGGLGRMRGAKMMEGADDTETQKQGEYLRGLGATNQMDPIAIGHLIGKDFQAQSAAEQAKGRKFNAMDYLRHKGYGNQEDVNALMAFSGLEGYVATPEIEELKRSGKYKGAFTEAFMPLAADSARPTVGEALSPVETALAVDPVFQARKGALSEELGSTAMGAGPVEHYQNIMREANALAQAGGGKHPLSQFWTLGMGDFKDLSASSGWGMGTFAIGATRKVAEEQLSERGAKVGMDPFSFAGDVTMKQRAEDVWEYEQEIARRGGTVGVDTTKLEDLAQKQLEASQDLRRAFEQGLKGAGMGRAPDAAPPRAGAMR